MTNLLVEERIYTVTLRRKEKSGRPVSYTGRFVKRTWNKSYDEAILLGVPGEGYSIRIATGLIEGSEEQ